MLPSNGPRMPRLCAVPPNQNSLTSCRVTAGRGQTYGGLMTEEDLDAVEPDVMDMYDTGTDLGLVCRVCGSLVAAAGQYPRAHWDWHEASNGA
jgi:hypothetical protein